MTLLLEAYLTYNTDMKLKTLTWNIGGGKLLAEGADATLLASYTRDGLGEIISLLKREMPDIITLQETQRNDSLDQAKVIAEALGYNFVHDSTSESHIDKGFMLGNATLTKFPIANHIFDYFHNPKFQVVWEDGKTVTSFDKGYTTCELDVDGKTITVTNLHLIPFKRFEVEVDSEKAKKVFDDIQSRFSGDTLPWLVQGDFNVHTVKLSPYLPLLMNNAEETILSQPTTPQGYTYDHIVCRGGTIANQKVISDVLTDHFPVVAEVEL